MSIIYKGESALSVFFPFKFDEKSSNTPFSTVYASPLMTKSHMGILYDVVKTKIIFRANIRNGQNKNCQKKRFCYFLSYTNSYHKLVFEK